MTVQGGGHPVTGTVNVDDLSEKQNIKYRFPCPASGRLSVPERMRVPAGAFLQRGGALYERTVTLLAFIGEIQAVQKIGAQSRVLPGPGPLPRFRRRGRPARGELPGFGQLPYDAGGTAGAASGTSGV